ncbi:MAG: NADPH:quinone reductase [Spirochaetes bacterium]|nr:NADPH:quinone reductase [Spirochaetota bacterium]
MKAIVIREFGGPEVLRLEDVPVPSPEGGEVLVRVMAAGVNPADTYVRAGGYIIQPSLPFIPGIDGAGVVEAVGRGVSRVRPGDRVYLGGALTGTCAEYALAPEIRVHRLPDNVTFSQGAGVPVPYVTAYHALRHRADARAGETVLVHGASGGVGTAAVQTARAMGLRVFGTAGTPAGLELAKREGAHRVFDHTAAGYTDGIMEATGGRGVDIILEMLANVNLGADLRLIALRGRVVVIGSRGEALITPRDLMARRGSVHAVMLWQITDEETTEIHAAIGAGLEVGALRPVVGKELPLAEAERAHREVMESGAYGKIVLIP